MGKGILNNIYYNIYFNYYEDILDEHIFILLMDRYLSNMANWLKKISTK